MNKHPSLKQTLSIPKLNISKQLAKENIAHASLCNDNFYMLILSLLMICIGLDGNSSTIIIGGMIITPLLGSILSLAYGIAAKDKTITYHAAYNYLGSILIGIILSTLYFMIVPSFPPNHQILMSISLSYHDFAISIAGGITITVGLFFNQKLLPFIAASIATTLAPPLCIIGYGISEHRQTILLAAIRMFAVNSFFIFLPCLSLIYVWIKINTDK